MQSLPRRAQVIAIVAMLIACSCGHKRHKVKTARQPHPQQPLSVPIGTTEQGTASWYGVPYHGRPAADGEIFDMEQLVAAHRTLPFNTWLKVTNLNNGLSVNVRVIDRGPFVDGRIVDLSKAAARQIQMIGTGIAPVRLEVIAAPIDIPSTDFYGVQIGAFSSRDNAEKLRARYAEKYGSAQIATKQARGALYRVLVGKEPSQAAAEQLAERLRSELRNVFVVRLDPPSPVPASVTAPTSTEQTEHAGSLGESLSSPSSNE
jgi:rare lipoprotein A